MHTSVVLLLALGAATQARGGSFNQEQIPIPAIQALSNRGQPGEAATLAGGAVSTVLGAADPCARLTTADKIVATLGNTADVIAAAKGLVAAEQNTQVGALPKACADATLPTTPELRGVIPLVDPAVGGAAVENANSAKSLTTPFANTGMSIAQIMAANGFTNISAAATTAKTTPRRARSTKLRARALNLGTCKDATIAFGIQDRKQASFQPTDLTDFNHGSALSIDIIATFICSQLSNKCAAGADAIAACANAQVATVGKTGQAAATAYNSIMAPGGVARRATGSTGLDFGLCTPTMSFVAGRPGRKATESTFLPTDPLVAKGQQDALNPVIIVNRICDQLTNVCNASAAAKTACLAAKANVSPTAKNQSTADTFNAALGF
ncbi:hypothetical protein BP6252_02408 [Coleophoma cylindrospora]|uniref:Cell wall protein n=1 Tax=Coleophoma cylindrospora TaxID=1849047 RepID=A0A3D8SGD2_9HELO|nr:hypothetical protein BP6252_02408 [Coleophoma cylindrospora]